MSAHVVRCGSVPVPIALASLPVFEAGVVPDADDLVDAGMTLEAVEQPRLIVVGTDGALAAVLTWLMRTERLHVEVGFVPGEKSQAANIYNTGSGAAAAVRALRGTAREMPLVRDDFGNAVVGEVIVTGPGGGPIDGEAYVDDTLVFSGVVRSVRIEPTTALPGVRARSFTGRILARRRWIAGRAFQLGSRGVELTRDGIADQRTLPRASFYRFEQPWLLAG